MDIRGNLSYRLFYFIPSFVILGVWGSYMVLSDRFYLFTQHWTLSLTMVFGSFIAGATSEGGGAVAFPVFTKVLAIPPNIARTFALAIQTVGMGAASLVILNYRVPIVKRAILFSSLGGAAGIIFGTFYVAPHMVPAYSKIAFTIITLAFGFVLVLENRYHKGTHRFQDIQYESHTATASLLIGVGFLGGIFTSIVGTGLDFLTFSLLVLYFNVSEKVATPTSVVLMAINSAVGFTLQHFALDNFAGATFDYWLVCVPIVIFGAPLGAFVCAGISRERIVVMLIFLILVEFISTLLIVTFDSFSRVLAPVLFFALVGIFYLLHRAREMKLRQTEITQDAASNRHGPDE